MSDSDEGRGTSPDDAADGSAVAQPDGVPATTNLKPSKKQLLIAFGVMAAVLIVVFGFMLPSIVSYKDIGEAIRDMKPWQFAVIIGLWVLKWPIEGLIYSRCLPGLSVKQGSTAWASSTAFANIIPGPGDLLVRLSMYRTWGHPVDRAMVGMTVGGLFQNANRLTLPVIGVIWYAAASGDLNGWLVALALLGVVVLAAGGVLVTMIIRSEPFARRVGDLVTRLAGWGAAKIKKPSPGDLSPKFIELRDSMKDLVRQRWWQVWLGHASVTFTKFIMLLIALRFAGAESSDLSTAAVFLSYALVQLVTLIPITNGNIGVAEIAYIGFLVAFSSGSDAVAGAIAAGVIIFRIVEWLLVIPVGFIGTTIWRNKWRQRLGYDPFTILVKEPASGGEVGAPSSA